MPQQTATTRETVMANRQSIWRCTARPGLWKVVKVNPTNILLEEIETKRRLNAHPSFLYLADGVLDEAPVDTVEPRVEAYWPGTVVTFKPSPKAPAGLWVIVRESDKGGQPAYSVHPLGGSSRYYRGVRHASLTVVDPKDIAAHL